MSNLFGVSRELLEHPVWLSEPFTRGQAWVDLIGMANYSDSFFHLRGLKINVKRGQLARAQESLANRWKWSRGKIQRFLSELKQDNRIEIKQDNKITLITICNYDLYQPKKKTGGTTELPIDDTANSTANGRQIVQQTDGKQNNKRALKNKENKDNKENKKDKNYDRVEQVPENYKKIDFTSENGESRGQANNQATSKEEKKKERKKEYKSLIPLSENLPDWVPAELFLAFVEMRQEIKAPLTEKAIGLAISKLEALKLLGHSPEAVLNQSIFNNWKDLYKPKDEQQYGSTKQTNGSGNAAKTYGNYREQRSDGAKPGSKADQLRAMRENRQREINAGGPDNIKRMPEDAITIDAIT